MAASISQTRYDYKIKLQEAIKDGRIVTVGFEKCPLCRETRGNLFCDVCVNEGHFCHTQRSDSSRYQDKKQEWLTLKAKRKEIVDKLEVHVRSSEQANGKRIALESVKKKIQLLRKALADTKLKCESDKILLSRRKRIRRTIRQQVEHNQQIVLPSLNQKIANLSSSDLQELPLTHGLGKIKFDRDLDVHQLPSLAAKHVTSHPIRSAKRSQEGTSIDPKSVPVLLKELELYNKYLAIQRQVFVRCLSQRIFPIQEIFAQNENSLEMSMAAALKDASETAFIAGRWVHVDLRGENHCQIVDSTMPEYSGESSALGLFVMTSRYASDNPDKVPVGNASYGIQSALGFTIMFITLAAKVLDVPLPRKCSFKELRDDITEAEFINFVGRLHENILHLCASQGVAGGAMVDYLSLRNILLCLNSPALGRVGGFDATYNLPCKTDLCPLEYESEDEDEGDAQGPDMDVSKEWERVPSGLPTFDSSLMGQSAPVDTSTTGALINAAAASLTGWFKSYYNK